MRSARQTTTSITLVLSVGLLLGSCSSSTSSIHSQAPKKKAIAAKVKATTTTSPTTTSTTATTTPPTTTPTSAAFVPPATTTTLGPPALTWSPSAQPVIHLASGQSAQVTVTGTNTGGGSVQIGPTNIAAEDDGMSIDTDTCTSGVVLGAGQSCSITFGGMGPAVASAISDVYITISTSVGRAGVGLEVLTP